MGWENLASEKNRIVGLPDGEEITTACVRQTDRRTDTLR